jgi:hypothetical protein
LGYSCFFVLLCHGCTHVMTTETSREGTPKLSPEKKSVVYDYDPPYILTTLVTFYLACWHHDLYSTTTFMNEIAWCIRAFFFYLHLESTICTQAIVARNISSFP